MFITNAENFISNIRPHKKGDNFNLVAINEAILYVSQTHTLLEKCIIPRANIIIWNKIPKRVIGNEFIRIYRI